MPRPSDVDRDARARSSSESTESATPRSRPLERGVIMGRYVVLHELGSGGMGVVHAAYDPELDRTIALKLLRSDGSNDGRARLLREAQALAQLAHPNVVAVHDVGTLGEQVWLAMELVRGKTLRQWLTAPRGWREVLRIMRGAGEGLAAAHAAGLLHRDFKPDNVMVGDDGRVRVMDFGLARARDARDGGRLGPLPTMDTLAMEITREGKIMGTPSYMAPERFQRAEVTAAVDQFAFCVTLWKALYGEFPFTGGTIVELVAAMTTGQRRPPPRDRRVPGSLRRACERGLLADPRQRWPSMHALLTELARIAVPRRWIVLGVTGSLVALGGGLALHAELAYRCQGAREQLESMWFEAKKYEVEAALLGTGLSYAPYTWGRIEPSLDAYAREWAEAHVETCEATSVRQEQSVDVMDLRMECLHLRKVALREVVGVLAHADVEQVEHAVVLVAGLPSISHCEDVEALRAELPPAYPSTTAHVQALREQLAQARALRMAGILERGAEQATAVMDEADALGYAPLAAEARLERAEVNAEQARFAEAQTDAEQAYLSALEHGHTAVASQAASVQAYLMGDRRPQHELGLQWARTALALAMARPSEPELQARALHVTGNVLLAKGELDDALGCFEQAVAIRERTLGPDHVFTANSLHNLGLLQQRQGRLDQALLYHERALAIREQSLGAGHPVVAQSLSNIGVVLEEQGHGDQAFLYHQRALAIREQSLDPDHPSIAASLNNIGNLLRQRGELDQALVHLQRGLAILERTLGPSHPDVAGMLDNTGQLLMLQGRLDDALAHHRRALTLFEQALGPDHPQVAASASNLGDMLVAHGEVAEARALYRRALAIVERAPESEDPSYMVGLLTALANLARSEGALDEAHTESERALALAERTMRPDNTTFAAAALSVAHVALLRGDPTRARELAERALVVFEASDHSPGLIADARFILARSLLPARSPQARALAMQARDVYDELGPPAAEELAEVQAWLDEHGGEGSRRQVQ